MFYKALVFGFSLILILFFGMQTAVQARVWQSDKALFSHVLALYPQSIIARINLGNAFRSVGNFEEAMTEYDAAIAIRPHPQAFYNRGLLLEQMGNNPAALASYREAISHDSSYAIAYVNLGKILYLQGERTEAHEAFMKAKAVAPDLAIVHFNLGTMALEDRKFAEAKTSFLRALEADPRSIDARLNLIVTLLALGLQDEAIRHVETVLKQSPDDPRVLSLLRVLRQRGVEIQFDSRSMP